MKTRHMASQAKPALLVGVFLLPIMSGGLLGCVPPDDGQGGFVCPMYRKIVAVASVRNDGAPVLGVDSSVQTLYSAESMDWEVVALSNSDVSVQPEPPYYYKIFVEVALSPTVSYDVSVGQGDYEGKLAAGESLLLHDLPLPSGDTMDAEFEVIPALNGDPDGLTLRRTADPGVPGEIIRLDLGHHWGCA